MLINQLNEYYKQNRDNFSDNFRLKIHRAISWLNKAEQEDDLDMKFVSLWISFNAAYAKDLKQQMGDRVSFNKFLLEICKLDKSKKIYNLAWKTFSKPILLLLDNQFIFQPFWDFHNGKISETAYIKAQIGERSRFLTALQNQNTELTLELVFSRLYSVRNQIVHGGSTHNSSVNREQVSTGCQILLAFIPIMLQLMMEHHKQMDWGKPYYPVVGAVGTASNGK